MTDYGASIQLTDKMTPILNNIIEALNMTVSTVYDMQSAVDGFDASSLNAVQDAIAQAEVARDSNSGITIKASNITSSAAYISVGEGMGFIHNWASYNNGSMCDSLVVESRSLSYYFNSKKALSYMTKPYSTALQFNGVQTCFSAGSRLMVWAVDYTDGE